MSFLETQTRFPRFEQSREFFRTGRGNIPQIRISGGGGSMFGPSPGGTPPTQTAPQPTQPQQPQQPAPAPAPAPAPTAQPAPAQVAQPQPQATPAPTVQPINIGYQTSGSLESRLFQPVQQATQAGEQQLTQFADLFRTQAGPSRTFESINAPQTLETAIQGGSIEPAKALLQSEYTGPFGLNPEAAGNLMTLAGQLRARQQALGTGGGLSTTITQSAPGITGGEARYTAQNLLSPEYRARLAQATAGVNPFAQNLESEILGTQQFAQQRSAEEQAIAQQTQDYLTGRRAGITQNIDQAVAQAAQRQQEAQDLYQKALTKETPQQMAQVLREAQAGGFLQQGLNPEAFNTQLQQAVAAAPKLRQSILGKAEYQSIKDVPIGELGVDAKGRQTYLINGKDFRTVLGKTEKASLFKQRQGELEQAFAPTRGQWHPASRPTGQRGEVPTSAAVSPLYFGSDINMPEIKNYLNFDPGVRPSRGNVSTEDQRNQFNRINEILGDLDRIAAEATPFKAAIIGANLDEYLKAEEETLAAQKESLNKQGTQWFNQVRSLRKSYRKAAKKAEWGKIGSVVGGVLGGGIGLVAGGPGGAVAGYGIGSQVGGAAGRELA